jgi:transposase
VWLEDADNGLSERFRRLLNGLWRDLRGLDERVAELDEEINAIAEEDPAAQRLQQLRGVGPIMARVSQVDPQLRGRIYVRSRTYPPKNGVLATEGESI